MYVSGREKKRGEREGWKRKVGQDRLIGGIGDRNQAPECCICQIRCQHPCFEFKPTCRKVTPIILYNTHVQLNTSDRK